MRGRSVLVVALALVAAACADDGASDPAGGSAGPSSASIVTTTTAAGTEATNTAATGAPSETAPTDTSGSTGENTSDDGADGGVTDGSVAVTSTTPSEVTTTSAIRVGDPVVASEVVGEFAQPIDLAVRPGDDAFWIVQQGGQVVRFDGAESTTLLDLSGRVSTGGEQGLLGLVFHPDGGRAYVDFTETSGATNVVEYTVAADGTFDLASERLLLEVPQPFSNHNAGGLAFGPDGLLYVTLGDGGSGGDPERNASDPTTLLGSLLRIDPTPSADLPYTIPPDNPFADGSTFAEVAGAPEVWSWGLRNPWRIAFDPVTNDLWIPDVGQNEFEEINVVTSVDGVPAGRGADFGWSAFEGTTRFNGDVADSSRFTPPVLTYSHADGCSISGGAPYRGAAIPELEPAFVYSDYCTGTIWALDLAGGRNLTLLDGFSEVSAVRTGPDGELYVLELGGTLHRLVPG